MSGLAGDEPFKIVLNAASGSGDARQARAEMEEIFGTAGRRFEFFAADDPKQIPQLARRAVEAAVRDNGAVVAAGGDGTINAVAEAALPTGRPFGIVPQGTFNYSSRAHGIPLENAKAARALLDSRLKPVQVGRVNERIFLVNASLGLYPQLMQDREHYKSQFGRKRVVALWAGLMTLVHYHGQLTLQIELDGQREVVRTPTLFVGNNPLQLEQIGLDEAEDVTRRRLAGVIVKPVSTGELLWLALRGALGRLGEDERVRDFPFQQMVVTPLRRGSGIRVAVDGEIYQMGVPLTFSLAPQSLMLMVPREAVDQK